MRAPLRAAASALALIPCAAWAEAPRVVADIAPVHSLVARVMEEVGEPALLVEPGVSEHDHALRPSEARALEGAEVVVWMGPGLTPWLEGAIGSLAGGAEVVSLMEAEGTLTLPTRDDPLFEAHEHAEGPEEEHAGEHGHEEAEGDHGHEHPHAAGHDHAEAHEHAHEDEHGHEEARAAEDHGHAHGPMDAHAWLDPRNAGAWLGAIAATLAEADPANAEAYRANAEAGRAEMEALEAEIQATIEPFRGTPYLVFHDAYQYFEARFGVPAQGALSIGDASDPGPARLAEIRDAVTERGVACAFAEPQYDPGLLEAVAGDVETAVIDPLGAGLEPGPGLYPALLRGVAASMLECL
jgi:zinc transport system substrate-binding protein